MGYLGAYLGSYLGHYLGATGASSKTSVYARMMAALLPPGRLWRLVGESLLSKLLTACAEELARLDARVADLLDEAEPATAVELLPEYERELDLDSTGPEEERQARIVAREVARQRFRPVDLQVALASLLGLEAEDVVVLERTPAMAVAMGDQREIYRFFVYRDPTLPGTYFVESAQALLDQISHAHTVGHVIESTDFLCDDEHSLCDRDLLGA